jgi:hypothetical protein
MHRLNFLRFNQKRVRAENYKDLQDAVRIHNINNENGITLNLANTGRRFILPSTFIGGPRSMHQLYHDAMALVRYYGKPDCFITMTCNPKWPELGKLKFQLGNFT